VNSVYETYKADWAGLAWRYNICIR